MVIGNTSVKQTRILCLNEKLAGVIEYTASTCVSVTGFEPSPTYVSIIKPTYQADRKLIAKSKPVGETGADDTP